MKENDIEKNVSGIHYSNSFKFAINKLESWFVKKDTITEETPFRGNDYSLELLNHTPTTFKKENIYAEKASRSQMLLGLLRD